MKAGIMMKVKEMIGALQLHKKNTDSHQLMTVWGEHLDCTKVLEEYPRPQMVRSNYTILNGMWNYAFTSSSRMPEKVMLFPDCLRNCTSRKEMGI